MPSFDSINYSLRPSKSIQRQLVFDGVEKLGIYLSFERMAYIGFGSIWFTDFVLAHKRLMISDMISVEAKAIGYKRAVFNVPYATVQVREGQFSAVLPTLYAEERIQARPWMVWLDYDYEFNESVRDDVTSLIENAPLNSVLVVTFNGLERKYGNADERPHRLRELFGASVPDNLAKAMCRDEEMQQSLAKYALEFMSSVANDIARPGGFVPAFRILYRDGAPMITVGGVLPTKGAAANTSEVVGRVDWPAKPIKPISAPHLTIREAIVLQSQLPRDVPLSRDDVRALGFDLEEDQLEAFTAYYRHYPAFAQIVA